MELLTLNRSIEEAKGKLELSKTIEEKKYYKSILKELRTEKQELLKKEFKRG